ncbi:MAG: CRISPR-associated helicase Cas3' [Verrucomicrobia bacterium]|nr:CRISPR-associated helicase Cas3' [Deltaproteobacteria bacterium]
MENQIKFVARYRETDGLPQSLKDHLECTSALASAFAAKLGMPTFGELCGLLHDLGKYSDAFQQYLKSAAGKIDPDDDGYVDARGKKGKIDHSSAGAQYLWNASINRDPVSLVVGQIMALCIASHHSGLIDCLAPDGTDSYSKRMGKSAETSHLNEVIDKVDDYVRDNVKALLDSSCLTNELMTCCKAMAADNPTPQIREFRLGILVRFLFSALIDADRLDSAGRDPIGKSEWGPLIKHYETHLARFTVRNHVDEIRGEISAACLDFSKREKGLFQLSVPTGGGKTLASLRFALHHAQHHQMDRIIFVVPYTSIIDQNAREVRKIFEAADNSSLIVLEHHSNLTPENDTWQSKALSENWDAPIVFTTSVQLLETLFASGTRGARRMHQLANAVIVFDEIQTLPIKTVHLFNNATNFLVTHCGSTVVFCTATQPLLDRVAADKGAAKLSVAADMMTNVEHLYERLRRVEVFDKRKPGGYQQQEITELARQELDHSGSVLIVVNTKTQARDIYKLCKSLAEDVYHLSTSMCPAHRMKILDKVRDCLDPDNPTPIVCVSTQLIEAGVDVDFGSVIRALAGLDSIAQAAGRCNRNGRKNIGRVLVMNVANEKLDSLPEIQKAQEVCERVLDEFKREPERFGHDRLHPALMERFYEYYFFNRAHEMVYPLPARQLGGDLLSLLSTNNDAVEAYKIDNKAAPPFALRQSFKTAAEAFRVIDAPTEGVIVPYGGEGKRIIAELAATSVFDAKRDLLKLAQRYSVNMFPWEIMRLKEKGRLYPAWEGGNVLCLDSRHYSEDFGASVEEVSDMETLII